MFNKIKATALFFLLSVSWVFATNKDSLLDVVTAAKHDSVTILTFRELAYYHLFEDYNVEEALSYINDGVNLSLTSGDHYLAGKMVALRGYVEQFYTNDFANSIASYYQALDEYDLSGSEQEKYAVYLNLGNLYHSYEQYEDAIKFTQLAVENANFFGNDEDWSLATMNLGTIYSEISEEDKALACFEGAKPFYIGQEDSISIAILDFSIANIIFGRAEVSLKDRVNAIETYQRVRRIFNENQLIDFYLGATTNLASQLTRIGSYGDAKKYLNEAREIALEQNNYRLLIDVFANLAENAEKQENFKEQVLFMKKMAEYNDSLFNENKARAISETEIKYQTDKINAQNELLHKESEIKDLELAASKTEAKAQQQQKVYLYIGLGLVALFGAFMFNRFRVTNRQKKTIEHQKSSLEQTHHALAEKNKEIMDSIHYAKRIQAAVLPSKSRVEEHFSDGFVLYKPKDIVAGDFYWLEESEGKILYAAADCTGHGVPGAMVSVICNNGLNRSVREKGLTDPGRILDHTREIVTKEFEKSDEEVKDGMDISLCVVNKTNRKLYWAGANNPLWIIRKGEMTVYKPDKQPIGRYSTTAPFTTHEIPLQSGDVLYTFTDGYADQFGGPKGKKLMSSRMKKFILSIQQFSMQEQKEKLDAYFEEWRKNEEQVDDVCVIGMKMNF